MQKKRNLLADRAIYKIFMFFGVLLRHSGRFHAASLARFAGDVAYDVFKIRRGMVEGNLSAAFPQKSRAEISRIARQVYRNMAENVVEVLRLPLLRTPEEAARLVEIDYSDLGTGKADVEELARRYTRALEGYIRRYPEEWFWVHNRWKREASGHLHTA